MKERNGHDQGGDRDAADYCRVSVDKSGAEAGVGTQHQDNEEFAEEIGVVLPNLHRQRPVGILRGGAAGV